ncbi:MAG: glutamate-5-semialdehyde dehydrogenase [Candidatus Anoxymicrobium japonicum]|uniref:Gamma-glutamyl phosphate reductase n=1 Tax=Candidatus Anoxymicrobium japonicum TaxID=2013648 RepID=A0A2N3G841_9ACTN|nr:MAG: glutamate-5-semialdehyde dehydrogenase [Candidatus Anoxymicrobium japonicum]
MSEVEEIGRRAKAAAAGLAALTARQKDDALMSMADALESGASLILERNEEDLLHARARKTSATLMDRLMLNEERVVDMARGLRDVAALRDPVGEIVDGWRLPNGLLVQKVRVPLGVIGIIYEARPNVTVDATGLCLKSGNAVILRGSSSALRSNAALVDIIAQAAESAGLPPDSVQLVRDTDRDAAREMMRLHGLIDVLIPRGGAGLIHTVVENSTVPVIETGLGNCHVYVDAGADLEMAASIIINAKTQRPGVCNAAETMLVHRDVADEFLPDVARRLKEKGVVLRGDEATREILPDVETATEDDWREEYLDLVLAVKVVDGIDEAVRHIAEYGSGHSETIVTRDYGRGKRFAERVDSAAVYINASTRFTDGGQFGMGAEIGISTQKLHARGPMSLPELTSSRFVIYGEGQIRE